MSKRLYVGNISFKATEDDVRDLFSQTGEVVSVKLIKDASTGRLRGFGFVEMATDEDADKAVAKFNGNNFMDRSLVVNEAKPSGESDEGGRMRDKGDFGMERGRR